MDQYCNETVVSIGDPDADFTFDGVQETSSLDVNAWFNWMKVENGQEYNELRREYYNI